MIKLVATDIDGTLIRESSSVLPEEIFDLIRELRKRDIYFAAASGRQYMGLKRLFAPVADQMLLSVKMVPTLYGRTKNFMLP